jgi:hypothetical protein
VDHCPIAQYGQVEAVSVEGDELRAQLRDLVAEGTDQFPLGPLAHVRCADGVHRPVVGLPVGNEGSDANDRVVDVLREFVADGLADLHVGLADQVVGGCKPAEVGHCLEVPHYDAWVHGRYLPSSILRCRDPDQ